MPEEKKPSNAEPKKAEEAKPKADSTPAKENADTVPSAESGKPKQEAKAAKPQTDAEIRLNELIGDLKRAGLTPKELKTFRKEHQPEARPASEPTPPPSKAAEAPKPPSFAKPEPELKNFDDVAEFVKAHSKWTVEAYEFERSQREQQAKLDADVKAMRRHAEERYGPEYEAPLKHAAEQIFTKDAGAVPAVIKQMFNDSEVLPDLLYTLGTNAEDLNSFVAMAKNDPGKAIRKLVIMENLIREELAKPKVSRETESEDEPKSATPPRGDGGKFVKADAEPEAKPAETAKPVKRVTQTLPPPMEAGGLKPAPLDDLAAVIERINSGSATSADTQRFMRLENEREISRRRNGR